MNSSTLTILQTLNSVRKVTVASIINMLFSKNTPLFLSQSHYFWTEVAILFRMGCARRVFFFLNEYCKIVALFYSRNYYGPGFNALKTEHVLAAAKCRSGLYYDEGCTE